MARWIARGVSVLLAIGLAACGSSPVSPSGSVTVTTAGLVSPANGAQIANIAQPVTLTVADALVTSSSAVVTYTFEVATDVAFTNKVQTKDVGQATGQTSLTLDPLAPGQDYYWRVRTTGGDTVGTFTSPVKFTIGQAVKLLAPVPLSPYNETVQDLQPTLTVANAGHTGPVSGLTYQFDIAPTSAFATIILTSAPVPEGAGQTSFTVPSALAATSTFFWRARVSDAVNRVTGPFSVAPSFKTPFAIDLTKVVYLKGPNLSTWRQTGRLLVVEQDGNASTGGLLCMNFTDPGWPDVPWPYGGSDPNFGIYGNQWYFANIGGTWYAGAGEWLYRGAGHCKAGQGTHTIGPDSGFGEPFASWSPRVGEMVGFAASASARNYPAMFSVAERTNVVFQPWVDTSLGSTVLSRFTLIKK